MGRQQRAWVRTSLCSKCDGKVAVSASEECCLLPKSRYDIWRALRQEYAAPTLVGPQIDGNRQRGHELRQVDPRIVCRPADRPGGSVRHQPASRAGWSCRCDPNRRLQPSRSRIVESREPPGRSALRTSNGAAIARARAQYVSTSATMSRKFACATLGGVASSDLSSRSNL
jgi:hypothetical protein